MMIKQQVLLTGSRREIWYALGVAATIHAKYFTRPLIITSMLDGTHKPGSLHPEGLAVDIRTNDLPRALSDNFALELIENLRILGFDVVREENPRHIHIEYNPKGDRIIYTRMDIA